MSSLNPSYASQGDRPLPVLFGYAAGGGDQVLSYIDPSLNRYGVFMGFDGECDGIEKAFNLPAGSAQTLAFHSGRWSPIGLSLLPVSTGPDQGADSHFGILPLITPMQSFSGMCYWAMYWPGPTGSTRAGISSYLLPGSYMLVRGARCRYFDDQGNVTGYGFTTNPTWQIIEVLLRYKIKRQQPQIAGLTAAERALFNWPAIVAHAARNDAAPWYGNFLFAAGTTVAQMLETMLRACRSYIDDQDGQIAFYGKDPADSDFTLTSNHVLPNTFKAAKKDLTQAPNVFIPKYRDLDVPAVVAVSSMSINNSGYTEGARTVSNGQWMAYFQTGGVSPFASGQRFWYGDGSNAAAAAEYASWEDPDPTVAEPLIMGMTPATITGVGTNTALTSNGGTIGTLISRFKERAPTTVQHRRHQYASAIISPGIPVVPRVVPVTYDLGNMSYSQANLLMQFERDQTLGNDTDEGTAPIVGSVRVKMDAIDASTLTEFIRKRPGEAKGRFTVSDDLHPTYAGEYLITSITPVPATAKSEGYLDVEFRSYNANGYSSTPMPASDSLQTIASAKLPLLGTSQQLTNVAWTLRGTPTSSGLAFTGTSN